MGEGFMALVNNLIINIYAISILVIILFHSSRQDEKVTRPDRLYMMMLQVTILLLVLDIFSRFDGKPGTIFPVINHFGNFMIFLLNPILPSLWLLYVHCQVYPEDEEMSRWIYPLFVINVANALLLILTQFFGWYYYIDSNNIYHRGPFFLLSASFTFIMIIVAFVIIAVNRKKIEKRHYFSLLFFAFPPLVCIILQIVFYGHTLMLNGVVLSLLIVFLNIQNQSLYTDFLTEVNNRKKLEMYMKEKISASTEDKTFSAILIDMDNFKSINDTFGHNMGDTALQIFAKLLNSCLRPNDFISRFGGDEFCIVLDISDIAGLNEIITRINKRISEYNESGVQPYKLGFSIGYAVYDYYSHMNVNDFQKQIDMLMYENKQNNRVKHEPEGVI
jgi:diguanylate cyclase (GGDEF)-like protein